MRKSSFHRLFKRLSNPFVVRTIEIECAYLEGLVNILPRTISHSALMDLADMLMMGGEL